MRLRNLCAKALSLVFAVGIANHTMFAQQVRRPLSDAEFATPPEMPSDPGSSPIVSAGILPKSRSHGQAEAQFGMRGPSSSINGTLNAQIFNSPNTNLTAFPTWSGSFSYHGLTYEYRMVGTDPKRGSATTVVPTVLIPLRFVFADGSVYDASTDPVDGQNQIQAILNSPIFQNHDYVIEGSDVGNTQYGDAFQRANFWKSVSKGSPNYHVLLGAPDVTPLQTINVPNGAFGYLTDPDTQQVFPVVNSRYLNIQIFTIMQALNIGPQTLPIFLTGTVSQPESWGYHAAFSDGSGRTLIVTPYLPHDVAYYGQHVPDLYVLSHEVVEWIDDPFAVNFVPGFTFTGQPPQAQCSSTAFGDPLEVGDPLVFTDASIIPISSAAGTYHVTDAVFLDFFTRSDKSKSVNGQYSLFDAAPGPAVPCIGHVEVGYDFFLFPGAKRTTGLGINNVGQIVGDYLDNSNRTHGYLLDHGNFTSIDFPGARATVAYKVNDSGQIVGYFLDSTGLPHGFLERQGSFIEIDFPGAVDTIVFGINAGGDMAGAYDDANFITHSFVLRNGSFQSFDSPYAGQSEALAINDFGVASGINYNNPVSGPITGFVKDESEFSPYLIGGSYKTFPYSINNGGQLAGNFLNTNGWANGFVTIYGYPYQVFGFSYGNNDKNQIVGAYNFGGGHIFGYVADLPK